MKDSEVSKIIVSHPSSLESFYQTLIEELKTRPKWENEGHKGWDSLKYYFGFCGEKPARTLREAAEKAKCTPAMVRASIAKFYSISRKRMDLLDKNAFNFWSVIYQEEERQRYRRAYRYIPDNVFSEKTTNLFLQQKTPKYKKYIAEVMQSCLKGAK